jgi:hypothetical protein
MGTAIQPAFTRVYEHPHLKIEALSGSPASELHDHPELQITVLSEYGCLEAEWLSGNGKKRHKRFSGPSICVTPGSHPHAMRWSETANSFVLGVLPDWIGI